MEDLTLRQARDLKESFKAQELSAELQAVIRGVGLCTIQQEPPIFGVVINLERDADTTEILEYFPENLHENVRIKTVGIARARTRL